MGQIRSTILGDVDAVKSDGTKVPHDGKNGCQLVAGQTYFFSVGDKDSTYKSVHFKWDANIVVTLTLWGSDEPKFLGGMGQGGDDTTDFVNGAAAKGDWLQIDPATAVVYTKSDDGTTGGNTVTNATSVIAGTGAGGCIYDLSGVPTARLRFKAVVGGTGGNLRCCTTGKE